MAPAFLATQAPIFTLYGDGTVVFRNPAQDPLPPVGSVIPFAPVPDRPAERGPDPGAARAAPSATAASARLGPTTENDQVADAPTAIFTVNAGGLKKTVSIYALGMDDPDSADVLGPGGLPEARRAGSSDFDQGGDDPTSELYAPDRYRGILHRRRAAAHRTRSRGRGPDLDARDFVTNRRSRTRPSSRPGC